MSTSTPDGAITGSKKGSSDIALLVGGLVAAVVGAIVVVSAWPGEECGTDYGYFARPGDQVCDPTGSTGWVAVGFLLAGLGFVALIGAVVARSVRAARA